MLNIRNRGFSNRPVEGRDTRLSILTAGGSLVVTNDDIATDARFSKLTTTLQPGAYYLRVMRGFSTAAPWDAFDYTLTVGPALP